jgi:hypothetical protein
MDLGGGAVHNGENTRLPAAGARFRCVAAGVVPRRGLDRLALPRDGAARLAVGEVLVAIELRALTGANRCLRSREGWIDLLAPDGRPQLERIEGGAAQDGGSMWEGELERVAQWLTVAGHGAESSETAPILCDAMRAAGVASDAWVQTLAALTPGELAGRISAVVADRNSARPDSAAVSHAADLLGVMLAFAPAARPTARATMAHPYFAALPSAAAAAAAGTAAGTSGSTAAPLEAATEPAQLRESFRAVQRSRQDAASQEAQRR